MKKDTVKIVVGFLLAAWCVFETISGIADPLTRTDAFSNLIGFIIVILPFLIILFLISLSILNSGKGKLKTFGLIGIGISIIVALLNAGVIMWSIARIFIA